jgi:hypothetical protein
VGLRSPGDQDAAGVVEVVHGVGVGSTNEAVSPTADGATEPGAVVELLVPRTTRANFWAR